MYYKKLNEKVKEIIVKMSKAGNISVERAATAISWETSMTKKKVLELIEDASNLGIIEVRDDFIVKPQKKKDKTLDSYFRQQ